MASWLPPPWGVDRQSPGSHPSVPSNSTESPGDRSNPRSGPANEEPTGVAFAITFLVFAYLAFAPDSWPFGSASVAWTRGAAGLWLTTVGGMNAAAAQERWSSEAWSPITLGLSLLAGAAYVGAIGLFVWAGWTLAQA